jgi:hypothetical protein
MGADLAVRRVRLHSPVDGHSPRAHAETLLRNLAPQPGDHSVLIVRRLVLSGPDPADARRRLADLRRTASRPALGWVDPAAAAVLFADEAEALACLTADLLSGAATGRWWWQSRLPRTGGRASSVVTALWSREIRWLPAALAWLERRRPGDSVAAVATLSLDQARALLVALLGANPATPTAAAPALEFPTGANQDVGVDPVSAQIENPQRTATTQDPRVAPPARWARLVPAAAGSLPPENRAVVVAALVRAAEPAAAAAQLVGFAASLPAAGPRQSPTASAPLPGARPARREAHRVRQRGPLPLAGHAETGTESSEPPGPPGIAATPKQTDHGAAPGVSDLRPVPAEADVATETWPGGLPTGHASALYLISLLLRYAPDDAGWDDLGRFARRVLRTRPGRRARARDPLWGLLGTLSGEPQAAAPPAPEWWENGLAFLRGHDIPAATFEQPGRVVITRTHLDVVMGLEQIDLAARVAGLDQDPSWVPQLGRIIAFHFLGGPS